MDSASTLDFDEWMNLAKSDPEKFEIRRREHIESFFNNVPEERKPRLMSLQWRIDQTRKLSHSPMASCIAISNMMWDSVCRLNEQQYELVKLATGKKIKPIKNPPTTATILKLRPRAH